MAAFDYTTFTEVDPGGNLTVSTNEISGAVDRVDGATRLYKDFGAGYFAGGTYRVEVQINSNAEGGLASFLCFANATGALNNTDLPDRVTVYFYGTELRLGVVENGTAQNDAFTYSAGVRYYLELVWDYNGGAGGYGRATLYIRTGSHSGTLVDTLQLDFASQQMQFRYLYGFVNDLFASSMITSFAAYNLTFQQKTISFTLQKAGSPVQNDYLVIDPTDGNILGQGQAAADGTGSVETENNGYLVNADPNETDVPAIYPNLLTPQEV